MILEKFSRTKLLLFFLGFVLVYLYFVYEICKPCLFIVLTLPKKRINSLFNYVDEKKKKKKMSLNIFT